MLRRPAQSLVGASNTTSASAPSSPSRRMRFRSAESTSWITGAASPLTPTARTATGSAVGAAAGAPTGTGRSDRSDQTLAERVGHRVGAVAQLQSAGDVVQHVLHRALAVAEPGGDLSGVVPVGH